MHVHPSNLNRLPRLFFFTLATFTTLSMGAGGCSVNPESRSGGAVTETTCALANETFSTSGASRSNMTVTDLPAGKYKAVSAEIYFESTTDLGGGASSVTKTQFLETPKATAGSYSTGLRCREIINDFRGDLFNVMMLESFSRLNSGDFSLQMLSYTFNDQVEAKPALSVSLGADMPSVSPSALASSLGSYWNSGYQFVLRSGNTYEFIGTRIESGHTIRGKANFSRISL